MSDASKKKPSTPARRGGLGRGLGALIPSAPLGPASGKGHFWSALDNPPAVDDEVKKRIVDDIVSRGGAAEKSASDGKTAGHEPVDSVSEEVADATGYVSSPDPAVDITVDNWPAPAIDESAAASSESAQEPSDDEASDAGPAVSVSGGLPAEHTKVDGEAEGGDSAADSLAESDPVVSDATETASTPSERPMGTADGVHGGAPDVTAEVQTPRDADSDVSRETSQVPAVLVELRPDDIRPNPKNPRQVFDDDELSELSESIKEFGLLQPIVVRQLADGYELVMGERRLRASRLAGIETIPAIVRQTDDDEMLRDALLENIHRVQLHPLEEAAAYQQLIDEFGVTHEELAQRIKRSRPVISNTIRLLKLPTRVQNRVAAGVISGSHARALLGLDDHDAQEALATRIVAEGLSVRATEEAVAMHLSDGTPSRRATRRKRPTAPALVALADKLSDHFDTRAIVQLGRTKGKIVVEFASVDDLERIIAMMAPPLATVRDATDISTAAGASQTDTSDDSVVD